MERRKKNINLHKDIIVINVIIDTRTLVITYLNYYNKKIIFSFTFQVRVLFLL